MYELIFNSTIPSTHQWPLLFGASRAQLVYLGRFDRNPDDANRRSSKLPTIHTRLPLRLTRQPRSPPSGRQSIPSRTVFACCVTWASTITTSAITTTILFWTTKNPSVRILSRIAFSSCQESISTSLAPWSRQLSWQHLGKGSKTTSHHQIQSESKGKMKQLFK